MTDQRRADRHIFDTGWRNYIPDRDYQPQSKACQPKRRYGSGTKWH